MSEREQRAANALRVLVGEPVQPDRPGLVEFLLAQISEDEAQCRREIEDGYGGWQHESGWPSYRVLEECAVKRRVVELAARRDAEAILVDDWREVLRLAARPYADRPGFQEEWRC